MEQQVNVEDSWAIELSKTVHRLSVQQFVQIIINDVSEPLLCAHISK